MAGDCFSTAYVIVCGTPAGFEGDPITPTLPGALVVHGLPFGRGGDAAGLRYWHAWVEGVRDGRPTVFDFANGLSTIMDRADYYELGDITQVFRYNRHQAERLYRKHEHCGPWAPGWVSMGDPRDTRVLAEHEAAT